MKPHAFILAVRAYVQKHWFKLSLLLLILIACFKKDLNLNLIFNNAKADIHAPSKDNEKGKTKETNKPQTPDWLKSDATGARITHTEPVIAEEETPLSIWDNFSTEKAPAEAPPNLDQGTQIVFLKRFADLAIKERQKFGIPSSIILAAALRHSYAGTRALTQKSYNHFALPCTEDWRGAGIKVGGVCYRQYESAWASFRDHSLFITSHRFAGLRGLGNTNYKAWAKGLAQNGYPSGGTSLAEDLVNIIERYQLHKLDTK